MALQTTGQVTVAADSATAFAFVSDPLRLAQCIPGCHDLRELSPGRYSAVLSSKVSFITLSFKVVVEVVKIDPPHAIEAKITGESIGPAGRVTANAGLEIADAGEGRSEIRYAADVGLTGKLGGLGEPIFRAKSAQIAQEFAANVKAAIENRPSEIHA
jgi:carbon monoxide dehydrogenase subunit G